MSNGQAKDRDEPISLDSRNSPTPLLPLERRQDKRATILGKEKADFNFLLNHAIAW